jgi:5,6-dimethylbenzimidazole synthase
MQPWNFLVIRSPEIKQKIQLDFALAHQEAELMFEEKKRETYKNLKLEGILESPINICITCDRQRTGPTVIGRTHMKEMDLYSSVCAVQNFWLAARAEGVGVGWVSILHHKTLRETLNLPDNVVPIAYLCVGYVSNFLKKPELETANWLPRTPLEDLVSFDTWGNDKEGDDSLITQIKKDKHFPSDF